MNTNRFFRDIQLSSVGQREGTESNRDDSIIDELDLIGGESQSSPVQKVESFIYAEEVGRYDGVRTDFMRQLGSPKYQGNRVENRGRRQYRHHKYEGEGKLWIGNQDSPHEKKSLRQQIMEENKMLEQKLNIKNKYKGGLLNIRKEYQYEARSIDPVTVTKTDNIECQIKGQLSQRLEEQYHRSNVIRLYNFIVRELPVCSNCSKSRAHVISSDGVHIVCKDCEGKKDGIHFNSLIGILYDLQNKQRFQEEITSYQNIHESINKQVQKIQTQLKQLLTLRDHINSLKLMSRQRFKQINQSKFYLKKNINNFTTQNIQELQKIIPCQYLQQMNLWRQIEIQTSNGWKEIFDQIYKLMPVYLHDHQHSKTLSAVHKIVNYYGEQEVKLSVSQSIRFPIKNMERMVLVVDGTYNLPVFDQVKHLHLQFKHKKTQRQLSILFSNFPRVIQSLSFNYNHKMHSHISAQTFPFLQFLAPLTAIKELDLTITHVKQFGDILRLAQDMTHKMSFKLKVKKHMFSQQQLILPDNFFHKLITNLGPDLVHFQLELPESVDSQAIINYQNCISLNKLCTFKLSRGQKDSPPRKHMKILDQSQEQRKLKQKQQQMVLKRLISRRIQLLRISKRFGGLQEGRQDLMNAIQQMF